MLHDVPQTKKGIMPVSSNDGVASDSKKVQQNTDILASKSTVTIVTFGIETGYNVLLNVTFSNVLNESPVLAFPEWAVFIGEISTENIVFPHHADSTVDSTDFDIVGPARILFDDDGVDLPATKDRHSLLVRNISAPFEELTVYVRVKYIFNRG